MKKTGVLILWLVSLVVQARSQPYYFSHYQVEDGLSNNAVTCSMLDRNGFLWLGTKDGVNRFDGYSFKVFRYDPDNLHSIGNNYIHTIHEDDTGTLWIGTEQGLYQYDQATERFSLFGPGGDHVVRDIKIDSRGYLWFLAGFTLVKYQLATGKIRMYDEERYFQATSLCLTESDTLWVATTKGTIEKYDPGQDRFTSYDLFGKSPLPVSKRIEKLCDSGQGFLLAGTAKQGLKMFDPQTGDYTDLLRYDEDGAGLFVRDILRKGDNKYWIATESGIYIWDSGSGDFLNLQKQYNNTWSISDNAVYTLCQDNEGGIWAGTYFGGLNYYPKPYTFFEKFFPMPGENSLTGNAVREICRDSYGNLWIGTEDGGLNKWSLKTGKFTSFKPAGKPGDISHTNIHGLLVTGDTLWIGTFEQGLDLMNIKTGKVMQHYTAGASPGSLQSNFIYSIYRTRAGKVLLATSWGVYEYRPGSGDFALVPELPRHIFYTTIFEDSEGVIWVGSHRDGLYYFNPKNRLHGKFVNNPEDTGSLSNNRVNWIFEDSRSRLWIATEGGLCKFNRQEKSFKKYGVRHGLPGELIYTILEDENRHLWISTSKGLARFDPDTEDFNLFTKAAGLLNDQFNYNSAYKDPGGALYFGSVKGLIRFKPSTFINNEYIPPVYITGFQVYNQELEINQPGSPLKKSITFTDTLTLKHNQSSFSIDFAALSYTSPLLTEYVYKMEGLEKEWTYLKTNRKAYFTKLPPGDYVFRVNAVRNNGIPDGRETRLYIHILPPFWASTPAYILYGLLAGVFVWYGIRLYHNRIKERNRRRLEMLEHQKEKELYDAKIDFFTNVAHEIRTPLTLIKGPLEKVMKKADQIPAVRNNLQIMERNTDRLVELTGQLLDFRKTEAHGFSLRFTETDITALLSENHQRFKLAAEQKDICLKLALPQAPFLAYVDIEAFNKMISNLLDNALKYAESKVCMTLSPPRAGEQAFHINIKNDGSLIPYEMKEKIFESFYRLKGNGWKPGTGLGLALSRSLAELHKGCLRLEPPEGEMNVFVLTLPVKQ